MLKFQNVLFYVIGYVYIKDIYNKILNNYTVKIYKNKNKKKKKKKKKKKIKKKKKKKKLKKKKMHIN